MANKKSNEQKPLYPVDLGMFGRKFTAAARLGYAEFQAKHRGTILEDGDLSQLFGYVGEINDLPQMGFFAGFILALHENPVEPDDVQKHLMDLGNQSYLKVQREAFKHGYHDGCKTFFEQCQTLCETGWDLTDRLKTLTRKQCIRKCIEDLQVLYALGKAVGWWISFIRQSALVEVLSGKVMVEA